MRCCRAARGEGGVEARDEQVREVARDRGIVDQHLRDVALAEGQAGLQQVAAIGAQHHDDAPRHAGAQVSWLKLSLSMRPVHTAVNALLISPSSSSNLRPPLPWMTSSRS